MNTQATKQLVPSAPDLTNMIMAEKLYGWILLRWLGQKEKSQMERTRNMDWVMDSKTILSGCQYLGQSQSSCPTL